MKRFLTYCLLLLGLVVSVNSSAQDTIHWRSDYKLRWDDYQGVPDTISEYGAVSSCKIYCKASIDQNRLVFVTYGFFEKKKSWKQNGVTSSSLLEHEQGHFDITEYFARKLRSELRKYKLQFTTYQDDVKNISRRILS